METLSSKSKVDRDKIWAVILILLSIISIWWRLFFGWDQDESYNMILAQRIADGKVLFRDMWDLHQTAAIFSSVFCRIYVGITGTTEGIALYLRTVSVVIQLIVALYSYKVIDRYFGRKCAFGAAMVVANMLPRATQQIEYSTVGVWGCLICALLLYDVKMRGDGYFKIAIAALLYAMAAYSYPTLVVTVPMIVYLLIFVVTSDRTKGIKYTAIFAGVCLAGVGILFAYLFSNMTPSEFMRIIGELGKNGDHESFLQVFTPDHLVKPAIRIVGTIAIMFAIKLGVKVLLKKDVPLIYYYICGMTLVVVGLNITGIRPSGPFGLLERYIAAVLIAVFMWFKHRNVDKAFGLIMGAFGLTVYLGVILGSNLGLGENAMYLELCLIVIVVALIGQLDCFSGAEYMISKVSVLVFIMGIIFTSGYLVRINSTKPANVTQCTAVMEQGPQKGIRVFPEQKETYDAMAASVRNMTEEGRLYTLLTRDAISYYYVNGEYISAQYAATGQYYNEQWVDFYTEFGRRLPDEFLIDRIYYTDLSDIYDKEFGKWLLSEYEPDEAASDEIFTVLKQKRNN